MEPARTATAGARRAARPGRPAPRAARPRAADPWWLRVRWDRVQRTALLLVMCVVVLLYVGPLHSWVQTWHEAQHQRAVVAKLERQNRLLKARQRALRDPATLEQQARALGMVKPDERSYVVTGLPGG